MKKMMILSKNWYFSVQKALIYYTFNKSQNSSFILLVFSHVANFRYVANFRFLTLQNIDVFNKEIFANFHNFGNNRQKGEYKVFHLKHSLFTCAFKTWFYCEIK